MIYEKPEMEIVVFKQNIYMALSLQGGGNDQGTDDDGDMNFNPYD